jgi:hypothetical protein
MSLPLSRQRNGFHLSTAGRASQGSPARSRCRRAALIWKTASGAYRILGLIIENDRIYARYRADGATYVKPAELINPVAQNTWYVLRLTVLPSGVGTIEVWEKDDPTVRGS